MKLTAYSDLLFLRASQSSAGGKKENITPIHHKLPRNTNDPKKNTSGRITQKM